MTIFVGSWPARMVGGVADGQTFTVHADRDTRDIPRVLQVFPPTTGFPDWQVRPVVTYRLTGHDLRGALIYEGGIADIDTEWNDDAAH